MCRSKTTNLRQVRLGEEKKKKEEHIRMWANAQRDGRSAEYRWRPLLNAAKFGWRPLLECHAVTLPRREPVEICPKLANRSQPLLGRSSPYYEDMWRRYCCLTSFFLIVDTYLSCKDMARQSCAMVPRWQFFASCIFSEPHAVHLRPAFQIRAKATPCVEVWWTSSLQPLRLGEEKKKVRKIERNLRAKYNGLPYSIERP